MHHQAGQQPALCENLSFASNEPYSCENFPSVFMRPEDVADRARMIRLLLPSTKQLDGT